MTINAITAIEPWYSSKSSVIRERKIAKIEKRTVNGIELNADGLKLLKNMIEMKLSWVYYVEEFSNPDRLESISAASDLNEQEKHKINLIVTRWREDLQHQAATKNTYGSGYNGR